MSGKAKDLFESGEDVNALFESGEDATPIRQDWGDGANSGASVQQEPPGPESIAPEPYGPPENPRPMSAAEAFLRQFGQGGFKQGSDELSGLLVEGATRTDGPNAEVYRRARDRTRQALGDAQEQHPNVSMAGNMLGDIGSDYLLRQLGVPVTSQAYQIGSGAFAGLMNSDADLTQPTPESLMQAGEETALGGAAAYAVPMVGRYAGRQIGPYVARAADKIGDWWSGTAAQDWLENLARERALKASGYIQKDLARGAPKREQLIESAQTLLDEPGLIGPFSSKAGIADRLEPLVEREGQRIGQHLEAADEAALSGPLAGRPFNPYAYGAEVERLRRAGPYDALAFVDAARDSVQTPAIRNPNLTPQGVDAGNWLDRMRQTALEQANEGTPYTFRQANELKTGLQQRIFGTSGDVPASRVVRDELQRALTRDIDAQAEPLLGAGALADFRNARRTFGTFSDALEHAQQGANRDMGNNALGLKDWQAAQTFAQAAEKTPGLGWAAPLVAVGSKMVRGRADSFAARTADALAQPDWLNTLASTQPEAFGKYMQYIGAAAARSPEALGLVHNNLAESDPEYQQRMRLLGGQEQ